MKKVCFAAALAVVCLIILLLLCKCDPGTPTSSDGTTTAPPVDTGPVTETTEAVISSEAPTTYESGKSGNETTECVETTESVVTTEPSDIPTEGETEAPTEPKPTEPKPTEPKPTEPKPTEPKPTEPKPTEPPPTNPPHTHSWSAWTQTKAPTCTTEGTEKRSCSCGATETRIVSAPGHNMGAWSQDKAPTCGADGLESRSCTRCGWAEKVKIPATGNHSWNETAPTCTEAGSKTCTVCGQTESIAALGHDWVHHDEEGHWRDVVICRCGAVFYDYDTWVKHSDENWENGCTGYSGTIEWVVDKPAYDSCSRCPATR